MGAAALGRLAVVPKYGLLMVQLHVDGSVKVGVVRGAAALEDRRWGPKVWILNGAATMGNQVVARYGS